MTLLYELTPDENHEADDLCLYLEPEQADAIISAVVRKAATDRLRTLYQRAVDRMNTSRREK